jgi:hypothetical protein
MIVFQRGAMESCQYRRVCTEQAERIFNDIHPSAIAALHGSGLST